MRSFDWILTCKLRRKTGSKQPLSRLRKHQTKRNAALAKRAAAHARYGQPGVLSQHGN